MENTVSDSEFSRIPSPDEKSLLAKMEAGAQSAYLGTPVVADPDLIVTSTDWKTIGLTVAAQPDVPRNLTVALTDVNNSVTGLLTITGIDPAGRRVVETMAPDGAGAGKTLTGTKIFARVDSAIITDSAGEANGTDVIVIGVGDVIGLPMDVEAEAAVPNVYLDGARVASPVVSVGVSESGVDVSAGTYDGAKVLYAFVAPARVS